MIIDWDERIIAQLLSKFSSVLSGFVFAAILLLIKECHPKTNHIGIALKLLSTTLLMMIIASFMYIYVAGDTTNRIYELEIYPSIVFSIALCLMFLSLVWIFKIYEIDDGALKFAEYLFYSINLLVVFYMTLAICDMIYVYEKIEYLGRYIFLCFILGVFFPLIAFIQRKVLNKYYDLNNNIFYIFLVFTLLMALCFGFIPYFEKIESFYSILFKYLFMLLLGIMLFFCIHLLPRQKEENAIH